MTGPGEIGKTSRHQDWPVELSAPSIEDHRGGGTGVPFFSSVAAPVPGPHVMITGIVHGNELCGAIALDRLLRDRVRPARGRLTLGFCNVAAYLAFDPEYPKLSRFVDEDFNRLWDRKTLEGRRSSVELARARAIRPLLDDVDFLLDLHSMQNPTEPLLLAGAAEKGLALARRTGFPATVVIDAGHTAGSRMRDYDGFADPSVPRAALLAECGQHWAAGSADVALETSIRFLLATGSLDRADADRYLRFTPATQRVIRVTEAVTVKTDRFEFTDPFSGMEEIPTAGTVIGHDGDAPILTPYDRCVLIMPSRRPSAGQTAVRLGRLVDG